MTISWLPTRRPSREFMYRRVRRFLRGKRFETALDLACGVMRMAPYISAERYIGLDLNEESLRRGMQRGRHRSAVVSTIEDMPADLGGDLVLCLQTIGINRRASVELTMTHVERMIAATRAGGCLVANVGPLSSAYFAPIEQELRRAFDRVESIEYGRFRSKSVFPNFLLKIWLMERRPAAAADPLHPMRLFIAEGRRPDQPPSQAA